MSRSEYDLSSLEKLWPRKWMTGHLSLSLFVTFPLWNKGMESLLTNLQTSLDIEDQRFRTYWYRNRHHRFKLRPPYDSGFHPVSYCLSLAMFWIASFRCLLEAPTVTDAVLTFLWFFLVTTSWGYPGLSNPKFRKCLTHREVCLSHSADSDPLFAFCDVIATDSWEKYQ